MCVCATFDQYPLSESQLFRRLTYNLLHDGRAIDPSTHLIHISVRMQRFAPRPALCDDCQLPVDMRRVSSPAFGSGGVMLVDLCCVGLYQGCSCNEHISAHRLAGTVSAGWRQHHHPPILH